MFKVQRAKYKVKIKRKGQIAKSFLSFFLWILFTLCTLYFVLYSDVSVIHAALTKVNNFKPLKPTKINSYSAAVIDAKTGELLFGKREETEKPVASTTKILGAYVYLNESPDLNKNTTMQSADEVGGGRLRLPIGTRTKAKNFLYSSLIGSANNSAKALIRLSGLSEKEFLRKMNDLAEASGAESAKFVDSSGISPQNKSSAKDLSLIAKKVFENETICKISAKKKYSFKINGGRGKKTVTHTCPIFSKKKKGFKVIAAKTGYLPEVGNNLVLKLRNHKKSKDEVIVTLMGAKSQSSAVKDALKLGKWIFKNYK